MVVIEGVVVVELGIKMFDGRSGLVKVALMGVGISVVRLLMMGMGIMVVGLKLVVINSVSDGSGGYVGRDMNACSINGGRGSEDSSGGGDVGLSGEKLTDIFSWVKEKSSKLPTNEQKEKPTQSAKSLSNWSGGSQYSPVERFVHNAKCMSLSQFCKIKHETLCVTVATTLKFAVSKYGWFYYGCTRCSSKAPNPEKGYECSCGQKVEQPIPRYKIEIYVSNGESKYRFVFWDSECAAILGMTAEFMHNSMVENGEDDPMVYPDELEMLLNKKMAFRVKVQPTFSQASVWKLCDDEAFVKEIENDYIVEDNQSKTEYAKLVPNKENLETSAQTLSASGENDPESIILMTLAKDVVIADNGEEVDFEASGATQLSDTKPSKKLKIEPSS
ncbi:hypothetical protein KIW84_074808 [Lathyrus oleraceus]|uniref:Replication factor A C-terminal domain-containing protein n=1 Tax=Pisum sativum TaxID=3888 RepID=A0A9D4VT98_PEA|nr:hypothetical protein KIW84_074808 [Pisum sativum]